MCSLSVIENGKVFFFFFFLNRHGKFTFSFGYVNISWNKHFELDIVITLGKTKNRRVGRLRVIINHLTEAHEKLLKS